MYKRPMTPQPLVAAGSVTALAAAATSLVGWKPPAWKKRARYDRPHRSGGPKGQRHTKSPAAMRRKARSLAARKA